MKHELRKKFFNDEVFVYCSCCNYIRLLHIEGMEKAKEDFETHREAWEENVNEKTYLQKT
jgi:hypothetical protein